MATPDGRGESQRLKKKRIPRPGSQTWWPSTEKPQKQGQGMPDLTHCWSEPPTEGTLNLLGAPGGFLFSPLQKNEPNSS